MGPTTNGEMNSTTQSDPAAIIKPDIFFTLPPELREMVYDLVYGEVRRVEITRTRKDWALDEEIRKRREREHFKPGEEYPESDLSDLLVNKQYFQESCRVWLRSKTFCFEDSRGLEAFVDSSDPIQRFMLAYVSNIDLDDEPWTPPGFVALPSLRSFSSRMGVNTMMAVFRGKTPWLDDYSDVELASAAVIRTILQLRGLRSVEIRWEEEHSDLEKSQHHVKWAAFKDQVESLVGDVVTQPRETTRSIRANMTLGEALKAKKNTTIDKSLASEATSPSARLPPISDAEIPSTESQALRLFLSRPAALFKWMRDAADARIALSQS